MKKNLVLTLILLITAFLFFNSCRTENFEEEHNHHTLQENGNKISFQQFLGETKVKNFKSTLKIASSNLSQKTLNDNDVLSLFKVDTLNIKKLNFKENITYSFRAYNIFESPENLYNIVYFFKNNQWQFSILSLKNNKVTPIYDTRYGTINLVENSTGATNKICQVEYTTYSYHCTNTGDCKRLGVCDGCNLCVSVDIKHVYADCGGTGGGTDDGGGNPNGEDGGGSSSGYTDPSGYAFDPSLPPSIDPEYVRAARAYNFFISQSSDRKSWATQHPDIYCNILEYYLDHLPSTSAPTNNHYINFANWSIDFFMQNPNATWVEFVPMLNFAVKFVGENPDTISPEQIFARIIDLNDKVKQNSNFLLDITCAQLNQLDDWVNVVNHSVPTSVKNKIQNIKNQTSYYNSWEITDLEDGLGARLNMDLFPVKITEMPEKSPGIKYTHDEFFQFFRKNINLFAEKFTPINDTYYGINDVALWFSNNPLGALIHINIPLDDGTVVCSGYWTNSWIFSTIKAPLDWYHDGIHPVAGNRMFSYTLSGGDMYIYTRGVDRVSKNYSDNAAIVNHSMESLAFYGADQLWEGMQENLKNYIESHGGHASEVTPVKYRPKYNKIKDYIKGKIPISSLNCN